MVANADLTAHQMHQPRGDGQPQPGSTEPPRCGDIRLLERREDRSPALLRDSHTGVRHFETDDYFAQLAAIEPRAEHDFAMVGEFDRVAQQIQQHLPQTARIANHEPGRIQRHVANQLDVFLASRQRH